METRGSTTLNCTFINLSDLYLKTTFKKKKKKHRFVVSDSLLGS